MRSRIMYIEDKSDGLVGPCRVGRVTFSKTGATLRYDGRSFQSLTGYGFKANYFDTQTGQHFWISGPRKDGADGLYGRITQPDDVDADIADDYWLNIRRLARAPRSGPGQPLPAPQQMPASEPFGRKGRRVAKMMSAASGDQD